MSECVERHLIAAGAADIPQHRDHIDRYRFAAQYVSGCRVVDIACGSGYGSHLLVTDGSAAHVTGVDASDEAIRFADAHARSSGRTTFRVGTATEIPLDNGSVDTAVSLETIEHLTSDDAVRFVTELRRVLVPGGRLVMSTPLNTTSLRLKPSNPYHLREYAPDELATLLEAGFVDLQWFGQISAVGGAVNSLRNRGGLLGAFLRSGWHRLLPHRARALVRSWFGLDEKQLGHGTTISSENWRNAHVMVVVARRMPGEATSP